jgi:hypothetical protein
VVDADGTATATTSNVFGGTMQMHRTANGIDIESAGQHSADLLQSAASDWRGVQRRNEQLQLWL